LEKKIIQVEPEFDGVRIDVFLAHELDGMSRSRIQKQIEEGLVLLNGKQASKNDTLFKGNTIQIEQSSLELKESKLEPQDIPLDVVYEDEYLIAVNKPSGLVVHPGNGVHDGTLVNALLHRFKALSVGSAANRPGIVHRLDKETSGLLIIAKTDTAHTYMAQAFADRTIKKHYIGFCVGMPTETHANIDLPLERSRQVPIKRAVSQTGKPALTEFWLLEHKAGISAMHFRLHTGRTHQIRVHCSSRGFPILNDELYGGAKDRLMRVSPVDRPFAVKVFKCFTRNALHAYSLTFNHPFTGKNITITAPVPEDFRNAAQLFSNQKLFDLTLDD
jgi:23S rRNA pseudouridine1911/1915/1917 synthase